MLYIKPDFCVTTSSWMKTFAYTYEDITCCDIPSLMSIMHNLDQGTYVRMYVCTYKCRAKCDLLCQNPPLTHTMSKNSFHRQWIVPSIN